MKTKIYRIDPILLECVREVVMTIRLSHTGLSTRALNVLAETEYRTIGDIFQTATTSKLSGKRNCGKKTMGEISNLIESVTYILNHGK
jgi:DNA-directed RNA polymerase alpha subunit